MIVSPGLTDVPTDQTVTAHGRMSGCSNGGGSGKFALAVSAAQVTCQNLAASLPPTDALFGWSNGQSSIAAVAFTSPPDSPNKIVWSGKVTAGTALGSRIAIGLRLTTMFPPLDESPGAKKTAKHVHQLRVPLDNRSTPCNTASPVTEIDLSNYEGLAFQPVHVKAAPVSHAHTATGGRASSAPTTSAAPTTTAPVTTTTAVRPFLHRRARLRRARKVAGKRAVAVGSLQSPGGTSSSSFSIPESVLGAGAAGAGLLGFALLLLRRPRLLFRRLAPRRVIR